MKRSYWERTELERIQSQWRKLRGLHDRDESSAAIVRAATAAELAATFAVRNELRAQSKLAPAFVDSLLKWANGLHGKFDHLLLPLSQHDPKKYKAFQALFEIAKKINEKRNSIVHRGEFCNAAEAQEFMELSHQLITGLIQTYEPRFVVA